MSGISLVDHISPYLEEMETRAQNLTPAMDQIGPVIIDGIQDTIRSEGHGSWTPREKDEPWPMLIKTGDMMMSLYFVTGDKEVTIKTESPYAAYQDDMRPFMDITPEATDKSEEILGQYLMPE